MKKKIGHINLKIYFAILKKIIYFIVSGEKIIWINYLQSNVIRETT